MKIGLKIFQILGGSFFIFRISIEPDRITDNIVSISRFERTVGIIRVKISAIFLITQYVGTTIIWDCWTGNLDLFLIDDRCPDAAFLVSCPSMAMVVKLFK